MRSCQNLEEEVSVSLPHALTQELSPEHPVLSGGQVQWQPSGAARRENPIVRRKSWGRQVRLRQRSGCLGRNSRSESSNVSKAKEGLGVRDRKWKKLREKSSLKLSTKTASQFPRQTNGNVSKERLLSSKNKLVISLSACNWTHKPTQALRNKSTGLVFILHDNHNTLAAYHRREITWAHFWSNIRNVAIRDCLVFQTLLPKCGVHFLSWQHCGCTEPQEATRVLQSHEFTFQPEESNLHWNYYSQIWNLTAFGWSLLSWKCSQKLNATQEKESNEWTLSKIPRDLAEVTWQLFWTREKRSRLFWVLWIMFENLNYKPDFFSPVIRFIYCKGTNLLEILSLRFEFFFFFLLRYHLKLQHLSQIWAQIWKTETVSSQCVLVERVLVSSLPAYVGQASIPYHVLGG